MVESSHPQLYLVSFGLLPLCRRILRLMRLTVRATFSALNTVAIKKEGYQKRINITHSGTMRVYSATTPTSASRAAAGNQDKRPAEVNPARMIK